MTQKTSGRREGSAQDFPATTVNSDTQSNSDSEPGQEASNNTRYGDQPYVLELLRRHQRGEFKPSVAYDIAVLHDDWCPVFSGGLCTCSPDVVAVPLRKGTP
jgi:hypothetical protein